MEDIRVMLLKHGILEPDDQVSGFMEELFFVDTIGELEKILCIQMKVSHFLFRPI